MQSFIKIDTYSHRIATQNSPPSFQDRRMCSHGEKGYIRNKKQLLPRTFPQELRKVAEQTLGSKACFRLRPVVRLFYCSLAQQFHQLTLVWGAANLFQCPSTNTERGAKCSKFRNSFLSFLQQLKRSVERYPELCGNFDPQQSLYFNIKLRSLHQKLKLLFLFS